MMFGSKGGAEMKMKMKQVAIIMCLVAVVLTGCGGDERESSEATATPGQGKQYVGADIALLPDESMYNEENLFTTDLQMNQQGEPALYQLRTEADSDEGEYAAIVEYTLNSDGNWQTKELCKKQLLKRLQGETQYFLEFPYIQRGDDGNLYVLLKSSDGEQGFDGAMGQPPREDRYCAYSVLAIDEGNDTFREINLQTKTTTEDETEVDYAREYDVTSFHIMEDGTFFLVFSGSSAMWFDGASGTQTSLCPTIADSAFGKNVAYGESQMIYYSTSSKLFGIIDSDTLAITSYFGEEISEDNRKYEWFFDTDTTTWQTYAFNQSGLYLINDSGKKASAMLLSQENNFDALADANIYDILVGDGEAVYVLLRRPSEDSTDYGESWEYGLVKYEAQS